MPKSSPAITSFNGGLVSSLFDGRTDLENYQSSCFTLENYIPVIQGPAVKRPGTIYVAPANPSDEVTRLVPFQFNVEQAYILAFHDTSVRFFNADGTVVGAPLVLTTPYLEAELFELQFAQSADFLYITHPNHPPQRITRTSASVFTISELVPDWPAFLDEEIDPSVTISVSGGTDEGDSVTVTASAAIFDATHAGTAYLKLREIIQAANDPWEASTAYTTGDFKYFGTNLYQATSTGTSGNRPPVHTAGEESDGAVTWLFYNDGEGYLSIDSFTSTTVVDGTVVKNLPPSSATSVFRFALSSWSDFQGYPRTVTFYENRLLFGGTAKQPQTIWGSVSDSYESFKYGTEDADAFSYTINTNEVNVIQWLAPSRVLAIGTSGGEFVMTGSSIDSPITPTEVRIARQTAYGSAFTQPLQVGPDLLFLQRSTRKVREYRFFFDSQSYEATDLNIFSNEILDPGVVDSAFQQEPARTGWYVLADGNLAGLTFERQQAVVGWHLHTFAGAQVESIAVIEHPDGDMDQLWMVMKRIINGSTVRYIERMDKLFEQNVDPNETTFLDSAVKYSGVATDTVTGLGHLEAETVQVVADGAVIKPDPVVTSGSITIPNEYENIIVGLEYNALLQTMRNDSGAADGTSQGKTGRIHSLVLRVKSTGSGLFIGTDFDSMDEIHFRAPEDLMDSGVPLLTGDTGPHPMPSGYEKPNRIAIKHALPLPCTIVGLYPQLHKQDR